MRVLYNAVEVELNWSSYNYCEQERIDVGLLRGKVMECCRICRNVFVFSFLCDKVTREGM